MKVVGFNGKEHVWKLSGYVPLKGNEVSRSSFHLEARLLLTKLYSMDRILEEVPLPGSNGLTADFFIPSRRLMIETHGQQHYEFVPFFHHNLMGFINSKKNDQNKRDWCEINDIILVELPYGDINGWDRRIRDATHGKGNKSSE